MKGVDDEETRNVLRVLARNITCPKCSSSISCVMPDGESYNSGYIHVERIERAREALSSLKRIGLRFGAREWKERAETAERERDEARAILRELFARYVKHGRCIACGKGSNGSRCATTNTGLCRDCALFDHDRYLAAVKES